MKIIIKRHYSKDSTRVILDTEKGKGIQEVKTQGAGIKKFDLFPSEIRAKLHELELFKPFALQDAKDAGKKSFSVIY